MATPVPDAATSEISDSRYELLRATIYRIGRSLVFCATHGTYLSKNFESDTEFRCPIGKGKNEDCLLDIPTY